MKQSPCNAQTQKYLVAPLAGAWIETLCCVVVSGGKLVAPLAGAWIETVLSNILFRPDAASRPSRARGLKPRIASALPAISSVAPLAGAWIETSRIVCPISHSRSRPSRARGLKQRREGHHPVHGGSRPSRARGLKHAERPPARPACRVAPLAGAWIETLAGLSLAPLLTSRPSRARGLKPRRHHAKKYKSRRAPRGRVD